MENFKKITAAEFVRIVTGGKFFHAGYITKQGARWDNNKQHYVSDPLDDGIFQKVVFGIDAIIKIRGIDEHDWKTARARSKDIVHSDNLHEDLKAGAFYLMEHSNGRVLVHDYTDGANVSIKLMQNLKIQI